MKIIRATHGCPVRSRKVHGVFWPSEVGQCSSRDCPPCDSLFFPKIHGPSNCSKTNKQPLEEPIGFKITIHFYADLGPLLCLRLGKPGTRRRLESANASRSTRSRWSSSRVFTFEEISLGFEKRRGVTSSKSGSRRLFPSKVCVACSTTQPERASTQMSETTHPGVPFILLYQLSPDSFASNLFVLLLLPLSRWCRENNKCTCSPKHNPHKLPLSLMKRHNLLLVFFLVLRPLLFYPAILLSLLLEFLAKSCENVLGHLLRPSYPLPERVHGG